MEEYLFIKPDESMTGEIAAYRQAFLDAGDSMDGTGALQRMPDPNEWLAHCEMLMHVVQNPALYKYVPSTQFVYLRQRDHKIVGMLQLRHEFNDFLEKYAGHIGYSVRPDERRKGYAMQMLKKALPVCKEIGLNKVLVTCLHDNEASRRTILKNGGVYERTIYEPGENVYLQRYWIMV